MALPERAVSAGLEDDTGAVLIHASPSIGSVDKLQVFIHA
jgi:hypothetical protein